MPMLFVTEVDGVCGGGGGGGGGGEGGGGGGGVGGYGKIREVGWKGGTPRPNHR